MKRLLFSLAVLSASIAAEAQTVGELLEAVAADNPALAAMAHEVSAEKDAIDAENLPEDPRIEYSSFYAGDVSGQSGSELVISQSTDFPTLYRSRARTARLRKESADLRLASLRREILSEAEGHYIDLVWRTLERELLDTRMSCADTLLQLYEQRLETGDVSVIEVNRIKMERMSIQTALLRNHAARRSSLESLNALGAGVDNTFRPGEYPAHAEALSPYDFVESLTESDISLRIARMDALVAENEVRTQRQSLLPRLEFGYRRNTDLERKEHGFVVGGSIPLFSVRKQKAVAISRQAAANFDVEDVRLRVRARIVAGCDEVEQLRRAMSVYDTDLMLRTLEMLNRKVRAGHLSLTEYLQQADEIYQNMGAYLETEHDFQRAAAALLSGCL